MSEKPSSSAPRPHRPVQMDPAGFESYEGGADPVRISEAAHLAARALVRHGRASEDPEVTRRLVKLADKQGLEAIAEMWAESPARSLPGALWRLYAIRASAQRDPQRIAEFFKSGQAKAQVANVVAGVAEPPGAVEMREMADAILSGAFDGEFDVALERSAAFCRVVALGQANFADDAETSKPDYATELTRRSHRLIKTAEDLEASAEAWRRGHLD
ncbi:hypothetical protein [Tersicoccus sp. Bi-70]|uniref:hypothetical protein n=1 Tax=Tersicoccus sp. Bi-70 TaxID=1897634 RepID=UPI0009771E83|nr:hypothetical protein BGP79_08225 [Tersicoccus sp. Bi-70]